MILVGNKKLNNVNSDSNHCKTASYVTLWTCNYRVTGIHFSVLRESQFQVENVTYIQYTVTYFRSCTLKRCIVDFVEEACAYGPYSYEHLDTLESWDDKSFRYYGKITAIRAWYGGYVAR